VAQWEPRQRTQRFARASAYALHALMVDSIATEKRSGFVENTEQFRL
jgi:hypothetical protein